MNIIVIYIMGWFGLVILAIVNGAVRKKFYGHYMSELIAHQLSTLTAIFLFGIYIWCTMGIWKIDSGKQALIIGSIWLIITIIFEFLFGHYVIGNSWSKLLHDYNLFKGRVWVLVLIWTTFAPYLFYRMKS